MIQNERHRHLWTIVKRKRFTSLYLTLDNNQSTWFKNWRGFYPVFTLIYLFTLSKSTNGQFVSRIASPMSSNLLSYINTVVRRATHHTLALRPESSLKESPNTWGNHLELEIYRLRRSIQRFENTAMDLAIPFSISTISKFLHRQRANKTSASLNPCSYTDRILP